MTTTNYRLPYEGVFSNIEKKTSAVRSQVNSTPLILKQSWADQPTNTAFVIFNNPELFVRVNALEKEVKELKAMLHIDSHSHEVPLPVVDISLDEAKNSIAAFFRENDGREISFGDIIDALNIPLPTIVEACDELEKEGKIAGVN